MRVFRTKSFSRFAKGSHIGDAALRNAIMGAMDGPIDADLGGGIIKLRVARPGEGKSGGFRTIVAFKNRERAFFVFGFAKNDRESIRRDELVAFRRLAGELLAMDASALAAAVKNGTLIEVG